MVPALKYNRHWNFVTSLNFLTTRFQDQKFSVLTISKRFKPDPALYLHAAATLGATPEHCVVIEDSLPGVLAGLAAGMHTLFYNIHGETSPSALVTEFHDMRLLPALLQQWQQLRQR